MNDLKLKDIAEALSKQIPKQVVVHTTYYDDLIAYDTYKTIETKKHLCPVCRTIIFRKPKYCAECGQKLDWRNLE